MDKADTVVVRADIPVKKGKKVLDDVLQKRLTLFLHF
jgi:hypothetical protein